jgi:hypothetical protein
MIEEMTIPESPRSQDPVQDYLIRVAIAARLLPRGARMAFVGRTKARLERELGSVDLADPVQVQEVLAQFGKPEDLVQQERIRILGKRANGISAAPQTGPSSQPATIALKHPTIKQVSETARLVERLGDERYSFNNARSSSTAVETISISNTVRVATSVDLSKTTALSGTAGVTFASLAKAQGAIQQELARSYSLNIGSDITFAQSTIVNIPAHTNVEIILRWKLIWARGVLMLAEQHGKAIAQAPFEITVALSFDKETRDL